MKVIRNRRGLAWASGMVVAVVVATGISVAVNSSKPAQAFTYARNAWWVNEPLGATLRITPSGLAQVEGLSAASGVMSNALTIAGTPAYGNAVYKSLLEQLQCHLLVRLKTPYDLDTWRPSAVSYTHLDVYKRQALTCRSLSSARRDTSIRLGASHASTTSRVLPASCTMRSAWSRKPLGSRRRSIVSP